MLLIGSCVPQFKKNCDNGMSTFLKDCRKVSLFNADVSREINRNSFIETNKQGKGVKIIPRKTETKKVTIADPTSRFEPEIFYLPVEHFTNETIMRGNYAFVVKLFPS
ncbi:hypothetical protein CDAR_53571 [Caerostris darwini]|uniref:Uncharacterized protein n=1 Tax=Caerostris darwini TaxID=1538125 RepID=A0AAV4VQW3_9ARAC|nr:hypothetical protein CDAR_53571 [Caerostris darwini]